MDDDLIADLKRRVEEAEERANNLEAYAEELRAQVLEIDRLTIGDSAYDEWREAVAPLLGLRFCVDTRIFEPL